MKRITLAAGLLLGAALVPAGGAWAGDSGQPTADQIIEARQAGQDVVYSVISDMKAAVAAKADVKPFADSAGALARWFHNFPALFPAGTETGHDTKAKPEVFSNAAGFAKAAQAASDAAADLSAAAKSGDQSAFAEKFKALGAACGACHKEFKVKT